jgi:hypothetical protein
METIMKKLLSGFMVLAWCVLSIGGCASTQEKRMGLLNKTLQAYYTSMRWEAFEGTQAFVRPDLRREGSARTQAVKLVAYDVILGPAMVGDDQAVQAVQIRYYTNTNPRESNLIDRQTWEFDVEKGHWWLTSKPPDFK